MNMITQPDQPIRFTWRRPHTIAVIANLQTHHKKLGKEKKLDAGLVSRVFLEE